MKTLAKTLAVLAVVLLTVSFAPAQVQAGNVQLTWDPPTTNADGTPLTDLAGFKVYSGRTTRTYGTGIVVAGATIKTFTLTSVPLGVNYFAVTAYDTSGNESAYSNEVMVDVKDITSPTAPSGCTGKQVQ